MKGTILIVDDSPIIRKLVPFLLRQAGVEFESILEAADGSEALLLLRSHKVALILCDISMPGMTGIELLSRLRQEGLAIGVPIFMITAEHDDAQLKQAMLCGARGYIRKPFTADHIRNCLQPLLAA
jgi:two-component system, chemotaxis family, chemotaxis protein CheY